MATGAGGGVPRPQPRAQVQGCPRRGARSAAPGFRAKLRACPREVVAPVQRGKELREKRGSGDSGGCARALFLFFHFFPTPVLVQSFGSSPFLLPLGAGFSPRPVSPPLVYAICWGVAEGDVLFSPEAQREGETPTLEGTRVNT